MFAGLQFKHWQHQVIENNILLLSFDRENQSANTLSQEVLRELGSLIERIAIDPPKGVIIRSAKSAGFIAGADIREFKAFAENNTVGDALKNGHRVFDALAALPCPTVAAIHGYCMGGGTELALACDYRVATRQANTAIALPEVKLGIHPGWGGLARLPYLIGAPKAMDMMLTGRSIRAAAALSMGLVDALSNNQDDLIEKAQSLIVRRPSRTLAQRVTAAATNLWPARQVLAQMIAKQLARKANRKHYPAPYAMLEVWRKNGGSVASLLKAEIRSAAKLAVTPTARNLVRVYFLQEQLKALGANKDHGILNVHVIGAGVMGGDIAAWCALRGFNVTLQDREMKFIQPALDRAQELFAKSARAPDSLEAASKRLQADVEGKGVADADLVIEAIYENKEAKQALYAIVEPQLKAHALLATNTSSIPLESLRETLKNPSRFLGMHFFNPVAKMPLVELVRHDHLDAEAQSRALGFIKSIDRLPVPVASSPGFLVNRILMPYILEAVTAHSEGIPGPVIDRAAKQWGMPMGPIELADQVGLDVCASVGKILSEFLNLPLPKGFESLIEAGKRGKKDGEGFYLWENGRAVKPAVPKEYKAPDDLAERLIYPMLNEAVACLNEGVVESTELLDAGVIFGTGFAPFRGGPCQTIREIGVDVIKAKLQDLDNNYGVRFAPKQGWEKLAN